MCSSEEVKEFCLDTMEEEITSLESHLSGEDPIIGFCHNDLQYGNIMMDEDTRSVTIIVSSFSLLSVLLPHKQGLHSLINC